MIEPGEEYLGWVLGALCTSVGTFMSTHKANLETPAPVFDFLGFRFDCPKLELSVKPARREKILKQIQTIRNHLTVRFDDLESLRGRLVSIALVCPFSRLYTREMNRLLQIAEAHLQVRVTILFL